ncbi:MULTISPECIES: YbaY family lipoprotein [unclassified Pseudodesulfovibrio]|uniref:YbaY family lipoprotein n=1 Tax=unclassified Pseudodesulfovibrio TaxID=2661612 RepID=UPI000FEBF8AA|nr:MULTISPECIES: YbaY family lipoprotein [unclassified Pseudodesulfovibrio]MCJ2165364.1 YbaY family lipoprotein [Pseudodesulfovibrio sp. S3-i]RWU02826.1 hypothetical protein DWB63_14320 [Pseudodesulfovibrio sp. S3]
MKSTILAMLALCALSLISLSGCKGDPVADNPNAIALKTSVHYQELLLLPPGCMLTVSLQNISQLNSATNTVASTTVTVQAAPPYEVILKYDAQRISDRLSYALHARIELDGQLLFTNNTRIDPFAGPAGQPIKILVQKVKR